MPRPKANPFPEGSAEYEDFNIQRENLRAERQAEREVNPRPPATERNITVRVSVEAINAAKALGTLSGIAYREILATAAMNGIEGFVAQVQKKLTGDPSEDMPF